MDTGKVLRSDKPLNVLVGDKLSEWKDDPVGFVNETMGINLYKWQKTFLTAIVKYNRVACRSGHGVGKSAVISFVIIWFLFTRYPAKIIVTAPKADQLQDVIWSEVAIWRRKLPSILRDSLVIQSDQIYIDGMQKENFAVARTARKETPEGLQGQHSPNQLIICEEASGIPEASFDVLEGAMSTKNAKMALIGNPTRLKGYFYRSFHQDKKRFFRMHVSSEVAEGIDPEWLNYYKAKYTEKSNTYKVRVRGEFPTEDEKAVIPLWLAEEARYRELETSDQFYKTIWGVDVARYGDDRSALAKRCGDRQLEAVKWWRNQSVTQLADLIVEEYELTKIINPSKVPFLINIDVIGLGAGVFDILNDRGLPVVGVNVSEGSSNKPQYFRKRDELYFAIREWLETNRVSLILEDEELVNELTLPHYDVLDRGMKKVESKKELKARGETSPDLSDAFMLTFASGYDKLFKEVTIERPGPIKPDSYAKREEPMSWITL